MHNPWKRKTVHELIEGQIVMNSSWICSWTTLIGQQLAFYDLEFMNCLWIHCWIMNKYLMNCAVKAYEYPMNLYFNEFVIRRVHSQF